MKKVFIKNIISIALLLIGCVSVLAVNQPNIIIILADDLGYGDLGCYGNKTIRTPNLDRMAENGMRCTDFYSAAAWCMPSRKGLLTGNHPHRGGLNNKKYLAERITLAEMLKENGYVTAILGKWHLGLNTNSPNAQGFDYWYGTKGSNDVPPPKGRKQTYETFKTAKEEDWPVPLYRNGKIIEKPAKQSLFIQRYTQEAINFIDRNKEKPFFLYIAHNMPHVPLFASEKFRGRSKGGLYGDVVEELDWSVGEVVRKLESENLAENSLIIFTSDNGPWTMFKEFGGTAAPLRGEKSTCWEGGIRVPAIFYWPGRIKPSVCSEFMVNIDLYRTIASITGSRVLQGEAVDSVDMSNVIFHGGKSNRKNYLFIHKVPLALRSGDYKIHFGTRNRTRNPYTGARENAVMLKNPLLFNLRKDMAETTDIADHYPEIVHRLTGEFNAAVKDILGKTF